MFLDEFKKIKELNSIKVDYFEDFMKAYPENNRNKMQKEFLTYLTKSPPFLNFIDNLMDK